MPKYDYECEECQNIEERIKSFSERQYCKCGGRMKRLFSPQGTVFQVRWGKPRVRAKVKKMGA